MLSCRSEGTESLDPCNLTWSTVRSPRTDLGLPRFHNLNIFEHGRPSWDLQSCNNLQQSAAVSFHAFFCLLIKDIPMTLQLELGRMRMLCIALLYVSR